ncbi:RNA-directed DNA polymerase, eukaryota [Tanacetum coccineum]
MYHVTSLHAKNKDKLMFSVAIVVDLIMGDNDWQEVSRKKHESVSQRLNFTGISESYGKVVDVFIPNRKSKAGKRFAFVRFIRVENIDRLVGNLCTIWIGRLHLHANVVRYECTNQPNAPSIPTSILPALVLDDTCVNERDLSRHVLGRVKDFNSIPNLRTLLFKEEFPEVVKHDFVSDERVVWVDIEGVPLNVWTRETFLKIGKKWGETMDIEENLDSSFARKRLCIKTKQPDNILEMFKVVFKGKVFMARAKELFTWNPIFLEHKESEYISDDESLHVKKNKSGGSQNGDDDLEDDSDVEGVSDTIFGDKPSSPNNSDVQDSKSSFSHPPGFTQEVLKKTQENEHVVEDLCNETGKETSPLVHAKVMNFSYEVHKNETPNEDSTSHYSHNVHQGGSIFEVMDCMIQVGKSMGYTMEGCMKDIEHIIGSQGADTIFK